MRHLLSALALAGLLAASGAAVADEVDHYEAQPSRTLEEALTNLAEYNDRLSAIMEKDELTPDDLDAIHQLTYTLENALARFNTEVEGMAVNLEEVHLASERLDRETLREHGPRYLRKARMLAGQDE
ncbi:DUF6746 family protein [Spiribacter halobius]|uniref:Uncharacterized protein n=1 Tax=Sediminicurvatus halobius TaxID=2182432 RepID=A0A2U2MWU9_9GAMM|nr:DUF6746 family protein [Spiribacter halobius]PWG61330.1 hypothetical protein DEM34_17110 [Spiribacter halobius]UEX79708.1 hypothetical protein LMH63_08705 [Spiribacter halobius]